MLKRLLALMLSFLTVILCFTSCASNNAPEDAEPQITENVEDTNSESTAKGILLSGENRYRIVHPHGSNKALALKVYDKLVEIDPIALTKPAYYSLVSDKSTDNGAPEILVGLTNRDESSNARQLLTSPYDFSIAVSENKIAIFAETEERLDEAVDYFISLISFDGADVYYANTENYVGIFEGAYPDASIDGKLLSSFSIVIPAEATETEKQAASLLTKTLSWVCGKKLPTVNDTEASTELEIIIGKTNRTDNYLPGELNDRLLLDNGKLIFAPSDESGYTRLINRLKDKIIESNGSLKSPDTIVDSLSFHTLRSVSFGAVNITEQENGLRFNKCTALQLSEWEKCGRLTEASTSTGIKLDFYTNSASLYFKASQGTKFELFVNGESIERSTTGIFDVDLDNASENRITILFPNHEVNSTLLDVRLDEGATVTPYTYEHKFLIMGDSITQGYLAATDSLSWANRITRMFNAESIIQGISSGCFYPSTIDPSIDFDPDYIFVAYGTNDWSWCRKSMDEFKFYATEYYEKLREIYPDAQIIGITPIWRKDNDATAVGAFDNMCAELKAIIESVGGFAVNGVDLVPHDRKYYGEDICLHPNNYGFDHYANNLYEAVKDIIK
ncbi:MAG: hypothetical protein J6L85_08415 [Clostridia bacterium]|nr:hypothetical protein [Clostridia bacterium]